MLMIEIGTLEVTEELNIMKPNDFVDVHFEDGCKIGRLLSDEGSTVTVSFGNAIVTDVPKELCSEWVSV